MLRTTIAGLRLHSSRYVTTVLAIMLGVMFVSGTMVFADTLNASYEESVMGSATSVDAIVTPEVPEPGEAGAQEGGEGAPVEEAEAPLNEDVLDDIRALPEVSAADGLVRGNAVLLDSDGRASGFIPPAAIGFGEVSRFTPNEGVLPTAGDEVALATSTADQTGFGVGDTVTVLDSEQQERDFTVTGLVNFGVDRSYSSGGALVLEPATVAEVTGAQGFAEIDVLAAEGYTDEQAADAVAVLTGASAEVLTGEEFGLEMAESTGAETELMRAALLLFALIAMFVAGIVIYNTFAILIAQRQRELALLRCVGAKRSQVFRSVLTESLVVGLVASALGVLAGVGIGMAGARFGGPLLGTDAAVPVVVAPSAVIIGLVVGTLMTVCSALVPATRATRVAPLAALRTSATAAGLEKGTGRVRVVFGALAFALSAGLVLVSQLMGQNMSGLFVVTGAALIAFVGVVVLGPLLVRGIVRVIGVPLRKVGVPSMLAVDNSTRSPRRAATAMIALTVGATLITGYSVVSASLETTLTETLDTQFPVDYQISQQMSLDEPDAPAVEGPEAEEAAAEGTAEGGTDAGAGADGGAPPEADTVPASVQEDLESSPSVGKVFGQRSGYVESDDASGTGMLPISTYTNAEVGVDVPADVDAGDLSDLAPGRVVLGAGQADGTEVGDTLTVPTDDGELDLEVVAIAAEMSLWGLTVTPEDFAEIFPDVTRDSLVMVSGAEGADAAELRDAVYTAVDEHPTLQVASVAEMKNQFAEMLDIAFYTIAAMLGLAIIIAVFGISNTMALSVLERTRESALLRALGLAKGQLRRMLSVEAVLLCLIGAGIGVVLGVAFGWAGAASVLPNMVFTVPVSQIALFIGIAVLAGLLAAVLPARRAAGTSITGALASE